MAENKDNIVPNNEGGSHEISKHKQKKRTHPVMTDDEYIVNRLENQMNWFDRKSSFHQKRYKKLKGWEFLIGASVPVLVSISTSCYLTVPFVDFSGVEFSVSDILQILAAVGGVFLVVITKRLELEDHFKFWKDYRVNAEQLQYQLMLYKTSTPPYDSHDAYQLLVSNTETLLNQENMKWQQSGQKKEQQPSEDEEEE